MYRALKVSRATVGQWVVILGAGGGLGHLGIQYANVMGHRVIAVDGGVEKEALCTSLGVKPLSIPQR
jgi:propanol-preferring alcohol dehydrogenase